MAWWAKGLCAGPNKQAVVVTASVWHRPVVPEDDKERMAKRQANAAAVLLKMEETETAAAAEALVYRSRPAIY